MAQHRKEEVESRIARAALAVFAERGYAAATIAEIAHAAGVSTGNVYRYHAGKEELFRAVVPDEVIRTLRRLLFARVESLAGVAEVRHLPEELIAFSIAHRVHLVILLGRADATPYAGLAEELAQALVGLAVTHFRGLRPKLVVTETLRFDLEAIYRAYIGGLVQVLARFEDPEALRAALGSYATYHLHGLKGFFAGASLAND